jgi:hypothetical protein
MGLFDGYQRGAAAAKADGGENKLTARALEEFARNGFGLMPGAQNREDEFRRGYSETYETIARDAQRNVPVQITSQVTATDFIQSTQGDFTMATNQTVEQQIAILKEMGRYIWQLQNALQEASNNYDQQMKSMEGRGMDATVSDFYNIHVVPLRNHLRLAEDGLTDEALPSLQKIIKYFEDLPRI